MNKKIFTFLLALATSVGMMYAATDGKLSGAFSVGDSKVVYFSQGNLQYQASTNTWRFAENQYEAVGGNNSTNNAAPYNNTSSANHSPSDSQTGWIDLFGWAASGISRTGVNAYQPYSTSTTNMDYGTTSTKSAGETLGNYDWGKNMGDDWRTLTAEEWGYLIGEGNGGTTPSDQRANYQSLRGLCKITVSGTDYPGMIILPDDLYDNLPAEGDIATKWAACAVAAGSLDYTTATFTEAEWTALQAAGAVFLPAAGCRNGTTVNYAGSLGNYWSSSAYNDTHAYNLYFYTSSLHPEYILGRFSGFSVRLVSETAPSGGSAPDVVWNSTICHDINCTAGGNSNNSHYNITATWSIDPFYVPDGTGFTNNTMTFKRAYGNFSFTSAIGAIKKVVINGTGLTDVGVDHWTASDGGTKLTWTDAYLTDPPKTKTVYLRYGEGAADVTTFTVNSIEFYVDNDCALDLDYFPTCQLVTGGWMSLGPDPGSSVNLTLQRDNTPFKNDNDKFIKTNAGWKVNEVGYYQPNATTEQINAMYNKYDNPQEAYDQITSIISDLLNYFAQTSPESEKWAEYASQIMVYELMRYNNSTSSYEHVKIYSGAGAANNETGYGVIYSYWKDPNVLCDLHLAGFGDAPYVFFMEAWIKNTMVYNARVYYLQNDETGDDSNFVRTGGTISGWARITALQNLDQDLLKKPVTIYDLPTTKGEVAYTGGMVELINTVSTNGGTWEYSFDGIHYNSENYMATAVGDYTIYCRFVPDEYHKYTGENPVVVLNASIVPPFVIDTQDPFDVLINMYYSGTPSDLLVKRTIYADGYYNTLCLPFNITEAELAESTHPLYGYETLKTMRGAQVSGSGQNLTIDIFVEDVTEIEAGQPYLISYPAEREDIVNPYFAGITVLMANNPGSVSAGGVTFQGMFAPKHIVSYDHHDEGWPRDDDHDFLFLGEQNELTWPLYDGQNMRGFRAYFIIDRNQITPAMAPANTRARLVDASKMPTGVENVQGNKVQCTKVIENGELHIIKNGVRYNAQGQIVK